MNIDFFKKIEKLSFTQNICSSIIKKNTCLRRRDENEIIILYRNSKGTKRVPRAMEEYYSEKYKVIQI